MYKIQKSMYKRKDCVSFFSFSPTTQLRKASDQLLSSLTDADRTSSMEVHNLLYQAGEVREFKVGEREEGKV